MWVFLSRLKQHGAFAGATAEQAFFVRTSARLIENGDARDVTIALRIGFAPRAPSEFSSTTSATTPRASRPRCGRVRDAGAASRLGRAVAAAARRLDDEPVAGRELDGGRRGELLDARRRARST